jgi:signal peptidase
MDRTAADEWRGKEGARVSTVTSTIEVEAPADPAAPAPVAAPDAPTSEAGRWLRRITPALSILCWFYLSVVAFLFAWVVIVWAAVGWKPMVVTTGSMQPAINPGDIVLSAPPEPDVRLDAGTVITFEDPARPGELITHRIETVNPDGTYSTRGDANSSADSYQVTPEELTGVGRLLVPSVGLPRVWLDEGRMAILGGWVVATILAVWGALHRPRRETP